MGVKISTADASRIIKAQAEIIRQYEKFIYGKVCAKLSRHDWEFEWLDDALTDLESWKMISAGINVEIDLARNV